MATITNITLNLQAGNTYTLHVPTTLANNGGFFPRRGSVTFVTELGGDAEQRTAELQMGFFVENPDVGVIDKVHSNKVAVDYKHLLPSENVIWFHASTGERARISITNMPIHSHESIITGGPAYGTYFSDYEEGED